MSRDPLRDIDPGYVWEAQQTRVRRYRRDEFDRMRYARRVLDALRPDRVDVLLVEGRKDIRVDRGHEWTRPAGYTWAMVSIPLDATREEIALAMMDVAGLAGGAFTLEALLALDDA